MSMRNMLSNVQTESYSMFANALMNPGDYSLDNIPAIAATTVGLRLLLRFDPKLKDVCQNSFTGTTLVATQDGLVPIEEIKIGDKVWAYDEANQTKSLQEVVHLIKGEGKKELVDITLANGEIITATTNHPIYNLFDHSWKDAGELTTNSLLLNLQDQNVSIQNLNSYSKEQTVYNLTVANDHTYFVGQSGVLGHNACAWDEAANNLGITHLHYKNGTAYIRIGTTESFHIKDIREVKKVMKALGNNKLEVETGFLANPDLEQQLLNKLNNNQTFMGGIIERSQSGISDFVIKFSL